MNKSVFYRAGNDLLFLGFYSNNFEDVEGDILTEAAHEEYATWVKETGITPPITVLHQPQYDNVMHVVHYLSLVRGDITPQEFSENLRTLYRPFAIAETKAVIPVNGFILVVGKVYDNKRELVERLMERSGEWGMSHGFIVVKSTDEVIEKYRSFEFSILPEELAANRATSIGFLERGMDMSADLKGISPENRQLLQSLLDGQVNPEDVEEATKMAAGILARVLGSKAVEEETVEEIVEVVEEVVEDKTYETMRAQLVQDFKMDELAQALNTIGERLVTLENNLTELSGTIEAQQKQVAELEKSEDEKIAAAFVSPEWMPRFNSVTSKNADADKSLLETLKEEIPVVVEEKTNTENPLALGFWNTFAS